MILVVIEKTLITDSSFKVRMQFCHIGYNSFWVISELLLMFYARCIQCTIHILRQLTLLN